MKQYVGVLFLVKIIFTAASVSNETFPVDRFEDLLRQTQGNNLSVQNTTWKNLTEPGENYGSMMLKIETNVLRGNDPDILHLVCKMPPKSKFLIEFFDSPTCFFKKMFFYTTTAPALLDFQKEYKITGKNIMDFLPLHYGSRLSLEGGWPLDEQAAIVLENLHFSCYDNEDRLVGMDMEHMEYAIMAIAELHAVVIALKIKKPEIYKDKVQPAMVPKRGRHIREWMEKSIDKVYRIFERMDEAQPYMSMLNKTLKYRFDMRGEPHDQWLTMIHSDYWVNNMMYRHGENGQILGIKILDFASTSYSYGIYDLLFLLISSAKNEVIDNHLDDLINVYYEYFVDTLRSYNVDTDDFSQENFDGLLNKVAPTDLTIQLLMAQVIKAPRGSSSDVNNIKKEEFLNLGHGRLYEEKLLHILKTYARKNWLIQ